MDEIKIPAFLNHLPVHRGYPVPYFVPKDEHGVYQLKYASQKKMDACVKYHKCCICFKPLKQGEYFFVSGPMGFKTQTDSHPPMHKECAEYSLATCPHLYFEKTHRTTDENGGASWQIREKPKEFYLVHAKRITAMKPDGVTLVVKYSSVVDSERFIYEGGKLKRLWKLNF
jgi:hypothetical protein